MLFNKTIVTTPPPIRKTILIATILFISLTVSIVIVFISRIDYDFLVRNISPILKYSFAENFDKPIRSIDVLEYDLELDVFQKNNFIRETAKIKLLALDKTSNEIELDLYDNFDIISVKINKEPASYYYKNNKIKIIKNDISKDTNSVEIVFEGKPKNLGIGSFWMEEKNGNQFLATLHQPIFASTWFPCKRFTTR